MTFPLGQSGQKIFWPFIFATTTFIFLPNSVSASDEAVAQDLEKEINIEEVAVVGNRIATSIDDLSGSISIINTETLELIDPVHIQEALRSVAGVNFQRGNGQESLPSIRSAVLTGAGACGSNLILEEGIPVRGAGFCNVNELFDTHFEQAGQIEILRGAQSAFYGSNGLTGSINVSLPSRGENMLSLELGADDYRRFKTAYSYGQENNLGRAYLTLSDDGGFRDDSGYDQQKLSLRHRYQRNALTIDAGLTATRLDQETAGFLVGLDSYRDPAQVRLNLDPEAFRKTESLRAWSAFNWKLNDAQSFAIKPYVRTTDMDFLLHFLPGDPLEQNSQQGFGWQSSFTNRASEHFSWSAGFDGEFSSGELRQTQDEPTQGSPFLQATIPTGVHYDYTVDARQLALFSHANLQVNDRFKVIAGARLENIDYDYDNLGLDGRTRDDGTECGFGGCRYSRPADRQDGFTHFSPKLEFQYALANSLLLRVSAADSFRAPQATELYRLQREQTVADLDVVNARSLELGLNWQGQSSELDIAVYQIDQKNLIIRDSDFFNVDGQTTNSLGVELSYQQQLNTAWSLSSALSYAEHEYSSNPNEETIISGNDVDTAPAFTGNARLSYMPNNKASYQLELVHVSDYYLDIFNQNQYPGHSLVHLRGEYKLNDSLALSYRVNNLSDRRYAERADFTSFTGERYFPGRPRSFFVGLRWFY